MNFYDFHIGDYASRTAHLEPMEDLAYRRLLDLYYTREKPLPIHAAEIARLIRLRGQEDVIKAVLSEFFEMTDNEDGWIHNKCEEVIAAAVDKRNKARASAEQRWGSERNANAMPTHSGRIADAVPPECEGNAPIPTTHSHSQKKPPKSPKGEPVGFAEFYDAYPKKVARAKAAKAFEKVEAPLATILAALAWQRNLPGWTKDNRKYTPLPATYLNDKRWEDEKTEEGEAAEWHQSRSGVEGKARELSLSPWVETEEHWPTFRRRVMQAVKDLAGPGVTLDQLSAMAQRRAA